MADGTLFNILLFKDSLKNVNIVIEFTVGHLLIELFFRMRACLCEKKTKANKIVKCPVVNSSMIQMFFKEFFKK